jgi:hypothetical protein
LRLKANIVVHGIPQSLFAAQIPFGCLDANVSEQELNLFEFSPGLVAQARACAAKVVRCNVGESATGRSLFDDAPDDFRAEAVGRYSTSFVDCAEDGTFGDASLGQPDANRFGDPARYRDHSNVITLPDQVGEHPVFLALLEVCDFGGSQFSPPQAAPEENCNHRVIAFASECRPVEDRKESPALFRGQPIAYPGSMLLRTFHPAYASREVWAEQARIGGLVGQTSYGGKSQVDC